MKPTHEQIFFALLGAVALSGCGKDQKSETPTSEVSVVVEEPAAENPGGCIK